MWWSYNPLKQSLETDDRSFFITFLHRTPPLGSMYYYAVGTVMISLSNLWTSHSNGRLVSYIVPLALCGHPSKSVPFRTVPIYSLSAYYSQLYAFILSPIS